MILIENIQFASDASTANHMTSMLSRISQLVCQNISHIERDTKNDFLFDFIDRSTTIIEIHLNNKENIENFEALKADPGLDDKYLLGLYESLKTNSEECEQIVELIESAISKAEYALKNSTSLIERWVPQETRARVFVKSK